MKCSKVSELLYGIGSSLEKEFSNHIHSCEKCNHIFQEIQKIEHYEKSVIFNSRISTLKFIEIFDLDRELKFSVTSGYDERRQLFKINYKYFQHAAGVPYFLGNLSKTTFKNLGFNLDFGIFFYHDKPKRSYFVHVDSGMPIKILLVFEKKNNFCVEISEKPQEIKESDIEGWKRLIGFRI